MLSCVVEVLQWIHGRDRKYINMLVGMLEEKRPHWWLGVNERVTLWAVDKQIMRVWVQI
jgi:hypothetical protein